MTWPLPTETAPVRCRMCLQAEQDRTEWLRHASLVLQAEGDLSQSEARRLAEILYDGPTVLGAEIHTWSSRRRLEP
jgi:hypothetical protein